MREAMDVAPGADTAPAIHTPYPGPRSRTVLERMARVEGAGLRTGAAGPAPLVVESASGSLLTDPDGNVFIDLYASFAAATLGHCHPEVTDAIQRQAARLTHASSAFGSEVRAAFQEALLSIAPTGLNRSLLAITGADANELALKLARTMTGRHDVIAFSGGYFGRAAGIAGLNGKAVFRTRVGIEADAHFFPYPYPYRWRLGDPAEAGRQVLELIAAALDDGASGVGPPAAIFVEPIQGNGGVVIPPHGFLEGLRALCDRHGALLVFDEIQSGFGRAGRMWASEASGAVPDLMTVGKGIGGGLALAAVLGRAEHMSHWAPGTHTSTFLANAVNLAAGTAAIRVMRRDRLPERSAEIGTQLIERLRSDLADVAWVGDVRGVGLFIGVEVVADRDSRQPAPERAATIRRRCLEAGVVVGLGGHAENVIKVSPPLNIPRHQLDAAASILIDVIRGAS
ncbi:MAG TPA: aspartate aminotransferase family protein [Candidatus Limnocylindria bacterium]